MNEMVERVAQALCKIHGFYPWEPDFTDEANARGDLTRDDYRQMARTVIEAMRVPTREMIKADKSRALALVGGICCLDAYQAWEIMIDAALSDDLKGE